ncbi:putative Dipeptide ABC transporter, substrate-binding protein [Desulfamplus magnetovallimortis]|uniref:Putative Dipeptide ABC transporter, substrate-binding protein n=1 Tax=Desulfamplus magnetovallimortis TaxID=1246637 RepID=A0A1W1HIL2_9BACT|nr:ABC transporter substrate-binding protein [Desulfamplus magnetovallimortis]SLM32357.1 putative Dipeptide ABC transporter, substrate-binding protein [Desulfamplus magnetovallimortis]
MKHRLLTLLSMIILMVLPALCFAKADLTIAVDSPPKTMNPHGYNSDANLSYMSNFFDGLLQRAPKDGKLMPALATEWERIDELTWKFILRQGVKFHNGNDFNAADVKFTFERMKDPEYSKFLNIANSIASIETPDDFTIIFKTVKPIPWFAETMHQNFIVDKESSEGRESGDYNTRAIGTGAYKFVEWAKGSYIKLEANADYWEGAPFFKNVEIKPITEDATRFAAIAARQADLLSGVPIPMIDRISKTPTIEVVSRAARRCIYMDIGNKEGTPFADLRVRKAIAMAINEDEIVKTIMRGQATPTAQVPDIATIGYEPSLKRLPFDPEAAKALLKDAGYPEGFPITIAGPNDRYINDKQICEAVAKYLAKIGLKVTLDVKPKSIFFDELASNKHMFYLIGWMDGSYDFGRSAEMLLHTVDPEKGMGTYNGAMYSDPTLDKMIIDSASILDRAERGKALQAINKKSVEDLAWIPLHYQQDIYAIQKGSGLNFIPRPDRWIVLKEITKK